MHKVDSDFESQLAFNASPGLVYGLTFLAAGLPAPSMSLDAGIWGGAHNPAALLVADVVQSLLPVLVTNGIATESEVAIHSLRERMREELAAGGGVAVSNIAFH